MKTLKTIAKIALGIGAMLILNDNDNAVWLNVIGVACIAILLATNTKSQSTETTEQ